jgi:formylglycine-generating enzyme
VWAWGSDWYRPDYYKQLAAIGASLATRTVQPTRSIVRNAVKKRVHRGGSFLCTDQFCSRDMVGTRGTGEISTGTNHPGFRCVKTI